MYRVLEALRWEPPDWVVVPGGNLGNVSAFGKAFLELADLGLLRRLPRLAVINAAGAGTFYQLYERLGLRWNGGRPQGQISRTYFEKLSAGQLDPTMAFMQGKLKINGDMSVAMKLQPLLAKARG